MSMGISRLIDSRRRNLSALASTTNKQHAEVLWWVRS